MTPVDPNDGAGVRELATLCGVIAKLRAQVDLLTTERDDARRQRDECAAALERFRRADEARAANEVEPLLQMAAERNEWMDRAEEAGEALKMAKHRDMADGSPCWCLLWPDEEPEATIAKEGHGPHCIAARAVLSQLSDDVDLTPLEAAVAAHTEHVAVTIERQGDELALRADGQCMYATTDEAVALIAALLADGAVHNAWLHGRGGR